jgi:Leucine-rich repeat (LRR) protein
MLQQLNIDLINLILNYFGNWKEIIRNDQIDIFWKKIIIQKPRYYVNINSSYETKMLKILKWKNVKYLEYHNFEVDVQEFLVQNLDRLEFLDCTGLITVILKNLPKLKVLYCPGNLIMTEIPETSINLIKIQCFNSKINKLSEKFVHLKELCCSFCPIDQIPSSLINLRSLSCSKTKIKNIPSTFVKLRYLDCFGTKIKEIPKTFIDLQYLDCRETAVDEIPSELMHLKTLFCNKGVFVPENMKKKLTYLSQT